MHPILFKVGPWTVYSYGALVLIAFLAAYLCAQKRSIRMGLPAEMVSDLFLVLFVTGILGSRLFYVLQHWDDFRGGLGRVFMIHEGGLVWYGGFLTAACSGLVYAFLHRWPILKLADLTAPYLALGQGIGRLGCFLNGCCYGKESGQFWGIRFPEDAVLRHPVQLYEAAASFAIFAALLLYYDRRSRKDARLPPAYRPGRDGQGSVILLYLWLYASARFVVEFFRDDQVLTLGLSIPQWTSIFLLLGVALLGVRLHKRGGQ